MKNIKFNEAAQVELPNALKYKITDESLLKLMTIPAHLRTEEQAAEIRNRIEKDIQEVKSFYNL